jgi:hypothetical protein
LHDLGLVKTFLDNTPKEWSKGVKAKLDPIKIQIFFSVKNTEKKIKEIN